MKAIGRATSLVTIEDTRHIRAIEHLLGQPVPRAEGSAAGPHPRPASRPPQREHASGHNVTWAGRSQEFKKGRRRDRP
jgi:hypothetical protein